MWIGTISLNELDDAGRWTVSYFSASTVSHDSKYPLLPLRQLVREQKAAVDPQSVGSETINYLGLENIRSQTGELVEFSPRPPSEIKSRSKIFAEDDVLFGRLRPELNKVYLAGPEVSPGICSNEFIVLRAIPDRIKPRYLRYAVASQYVAQFAQKLRSGASLPRMNSADLLDLAIPVPPIEYQEQLVDVLERLDRHLADLRKAVEWMPTAIADAFLETVQRSGNRLLEVEEGLAKRP